MTTDRRTFLKLAAAGAASAAVGSSALARGGHTSSGGAFRWEKAPCRFCGVGCGVQVGVEGGRVVAVVGDTAAPANKGMLCVKGYHAGAALYGADRLTTPLIRRDGTFRPISWESAVRIIADRVALGRAGFAVHGSAQWTIGEAYAFQKFMKGGLSNNNLTTNARFSEASAISAARAVYGDDGPIGCYEDLDAANVVILWGCNAAEELPVLFSRVTDRRIGGDDIKIIDVGTRRTRTTASAQSFVRCRPHTEDAVLRGVLRLLLVDESWDKDFVTQHCAFRLPDASPDRPGRAVSFEEWRAALAPYTPDAVQRISEVRSADLRMLADLFSSRAVRITSLWSEGLNQRAQGTTTNFLLHALHLLSGHIARPGDGPMVLNSQPSSCGSVREVGASPDGLPGGLLVENAEDRVFAEQAWSLPTGRIRATPGYEGIPLWERFSTTAESGGDVHTIWVQASNPAQTLPNAARLFDASRKDRDKFLIVSEVYPTPTMLEADLVLPSSMWVEKNGMYGNLERRTQQWFKMVAPPGDARDDAWQAIAVAYELFRRGMPGMKDNAGRFLFDLAGGGPIWDWASYGKVNVDRLLFEEYRRFPALKRRNMAPYDEYVSARGLRWPVVKRADGSFSETARRFGGDDGGKVEFYQSASGDGRAQLYLPPDVKPVEAPDPEFPFYLTAGPVVEHSGSGSLTGRIPELRNAMPSAYLEMNRQDANRLGIADGEIVLLESRRGALHVPIWIEGRGSPLPGMLFAPIFDERLRVMALLPDAEVPLVGQPDLGACAVRVRRLA
jgi:nitrate reductase NapA